MSGVSVEYQPLTDTIDDYNERIGSSNLLSTAYTRNTRRLLSRWKAALKVEPSSASNYYPIHWKSAKQRRAFFATNGFGRGIPTPRTHALSNGWQTDITPLADGGDLTVYNSAPEAGFVYGDFDTPRQPMFDGGTGGINWLDPFSVSASYFDQAEFILSETFHTILSPTAGVFD